MTNSLTLPYLLLATTVTFASCFGNSADAKPMPLAKAKPAAVKASPDALLSAIKALKSHVKKEKVVDAKELAKLTKAVQSNAKAMVSDADAVKACFDFVATYDGVYKPLWIGHKGFNQKKKEEGEEIHWAAFWVMQGIVDYAYTSKTMKTYGNQLKGLRFGGADYFPGKVEETLDPDAVHTVKINGSYPKTWGPPLFMHDRPARKPTGTYLPPGAIATVTVPESLVDKGYQVRVGAHSWDLKKKRKVLRLFRVSNLYDITSTEVQVASPLGGGIYIEVPYEANAGVVEVKIQNAVRSPYFSWKPFHKTTLEEWKKEREFKAPWADFQSETFMMQVPTSWIYKLEDPVTLMKDWDKGIDASNKLMGRPESYGKEIIYAQVDTQLRGNAFHPGYPSVNRMYDPTKDYGGYHNQHLVRGPQFAHSYEFHEQGHGYLCPKYPGDREAIVNLPFVAVLNGAFGVELEEAFRQSRSIPNTFVTLDNTAIAWMMCDHFIDKSGMKGYERQYQAKGHAKFVDVVRLFGWKALEDFFRSMNQDHEDGKPWGNAVKDPDAYTLRMSKTAGADLRPLIQFWGIPTKDDAKSDAAAKALGIAPSAKVYDLLVSYKNLVPKNNEAFREFAKKWWGREPSEKGFTEERNHAARWKSYDEKAAEAARQCVQDIIDRYFPNGRPKDDAKEK